MPITKPVSTLRHIKAHANPIRTKTNIWSCKLSVHHHLSRPPLGFETLLDDWTNKSQQFECLDWGVEGQISNHIFGLLFYVWPWRRRVLWRGYGWKRERGWWAFAENIIGMAPVTLSFRSIWRTGHAAAHRGFDFPDKPPKFCPLFSLFWFAFLWPPLKREGTAWNDGLVFFFFLWRIVYVHGVTERPRHPDFEVIFENVSTTHTTKSSWLRSYLMSVPTELIFQYNYTVIIIVIILAYHVEDGDGKLWYYSMLYLLHSQALYILPAE